MDCKYISECSFSQYLSNKNTLRSHNYNQRIYDKYIDNIKKNKYAISNFIFYGPSGVGKYSQVLYFISQFSNSNLNYEKKIIIPKQKNSDIIIRVSEIHVEIDFAILGCNAKQVWNTIYNHIIDITQYKENTIRFIVCKNIHHIHPELMELLYYYIQNDTLMYIFITDTLCCFSSKVLNVCNTIAFKRLQKSKYKVDKKIVDAKNIETLISIPNAPTTIALEYNHPNICGPILQYIKTPHISSIFELREMLYRILIYKQNPNVCIFYILEKLIESNLIADNMLIQCTNILVAFYSKYYNNYRSIYHLENIVIQLLLLIHRKPKYNTNSIINEDIL